jgi:hypothetical protein
MRAAKDQTVGKEMSEQFRDDFRWAMENYAALVQSHPGKWVVIHRHRVVGAGNNIAKIETQAKREVGPHEMPVIYVEDGSNIWAN